MFLLTATAARAEDRTVLSGHVPSVVTRATPVGPLNGDQHLRLAIGLPLRNREALTNLLHDLYNPASTNYHHYLTPEQFTAQFGPTEVDYQAVVAFARTNGFALTNEVHRNRMLLDVDAPVSVIEKAFNVKMRVFKHPTENRTFYAPTNEPSVPSGLPVLDISGLSDYARPHPNYRILSSPTNSPNGKPAFGAGPGGSYMGSDFRAAYVPGVTLDGTGQTVGLLQFDGFYMSDTLAYENLNSLPNVPIQTVLLDGYNGVPTGNGGEVEVSLDIEMVISMAPGISKLIMYEAGPFGIANDILNRMADDNLAKELSASWTWSGGPQGSTEQIFLQMASQGQTFCHSTGDFDAYTPGEMDDPNIPFYPSSSPNILQVGATTLSTTGPAGSWVSEKVWQTGQDVGSAGGVSSFFSIPSWQASINMTTNMGSTTHRNIPDVAMVGDNVYVIADQGTPLIVGGTSCATPLWAGFTALVNEQGGSAGLPTIGFMNPQLYAIGTGAIFTNCFHDIVDGNNTNSISPNLYFAVPGYDLCTGWGTPTGSNLINTLAPPTAVPVFEVGPTSVQGGNGNGVVDSDECDSLFITLTNIGFATATTVQVQLSTSTPGVTIAQSLANYPNMTNGVVATNVNPFEISTTPTFICGTPIFLTLTITCDQNVTTRTVALDTGITGEVIRYDNSIPVNIVSGNTNGTSSVINITNLDTALKHVRVSAYVFESLDFDLTLQLVGPDGTAVTLAQNLGLDGQNYGIDCSDSDRTTFDDDSISSIINSGAPFVGTFQPEGSLAVFEGKGGTNINGNWQLLAIDPFTGDTGTIECWSLFLTPAACTDGGGQCPGVNLSLGMTGLPNPVLVTSNITYTMNVTNLGPDTATSVALVQNLPESVTFVSANTSQGIISQSSNLVSCDLGTLVVGQVATVTVVVTTTQPGTIYSSASVGSQQVELNPADNSATVAVQVKQPEADLSITLSANPSPVMLDGLLTYTSVIANKGPSVATNVVMTNVLPLNVSLASISTSQGTIVSSSNLVLGSLGTLNVGSNAIVTIQVHPLVLGQITDTASVSSSVLDTVPGNNTATLNTEVTAASDLALTMTGPASVVVGSNATYQLNVQNLGPSVATDINLRDTLPGGVVLVNATSPQGSVSVSGNTVSCTLGSLSVNTNMSLTITLGTSNLIGSVPITIVNSATVTADQADPNNTNNSASISTLVSLPTLNIVSAGYELVSEGNPPTNGMIDPGETVSVALSLQNLGNIDTAPNLTATLLNSGGVTPAGTQVHNYGTLTASGQPVAQIFTFTASDTNGGSILASLQVQNNGTNLSIVTFPFTLSVSNNFANTNNIIIPDHGPGVPYPSTNTVSGLSSIIGKVTVTFTNFNHTYPDDVDMLLVGPKGQNVLLMSHAGYNGVLTNTEIAFDSGVTNADGTPKLLPQSSQILSGTYQPSQYGSVDFSNNFGGTITIPSNNPPPFPPYGTNLDIFNGTSPNGQWLLYVFDSAVGDQGIIIGGWSLGITTGSEVNPVVDLAVTGKASPNPVLEGTNLTYIFTVTNGGPNVASVAQFTNVLPTNLTFLSVTNSAHAPCGITAGGAVYCTFSNLAVNSSTTVTIVVSPNAPGTVTNTATVTGSGSDPNQSNNSASVVSTVNPLIADLAVTMTGATNSVAGSNVLYIISVTNNGPNTALGVVVTDPTMGVLAFGSGNAVGTAGQPGLGSGAVVCDVGNLSPGAGALIYLYLTSTQSMTITNTVTASTTSSDPNLTNNSASVVTLFTAPAPLIIAANARVISGGVNGSLVPGQTATVALALANIGSANTSNLKATLQSGNGVVSPSGAATYGVLVQNGAAVTNNFTFTVSGGNNDSVIATLQLVDGANNLGTVAFTFNLPGTNTFANNGLIVINEYGAATPYPANITISNLSGVVTKATVTVSNFSHQFPNDVQMLLAAPSGQNIVLMAHNGGATPVNNLTFTFDDSASAPLPITSDVNPVTLASGTYLPTDDGLALPFANPAPSKTSGTMLSTFNGLSPNGNWALYVFDNSPGDSGSIANGWSLNLSSITPVNQAADLGVTLTQGGGTLYPENPVALTVGITNKGPAGATNVIVTSTSSSGLSFVSTSLGTYSAGAGGATLINIGTLAAGTSTNFTLNVVPSNGGTYTSAVNVGSDQTDLNTSDNAAQVTLQVQGAPELSAKGIITNGIFHLTLNVTGQPGTYRIVASTNILANLSTWVTVGTVTNSSSSFQFTDTNAANFPRRYYRAILNP